MPTNTYVALDKVTVGTATNTVTFNSINQGYTDLIVVCNLAISSGTGNSKIQFNSDTGSNYSETTIEGTGSTAVSSRYTSNTSIILEGSGFLSTAFQTVKTIHLMNYSNTTTNKTCLVRNGGASAGVDAIVGLWRNTGAVTSFTISTTASTFVSGSTFSLYGIKAWAPESSPKATGGYVTSDASYWYHSFPFSGTFTPNQALTCDYLVVAGGGAASQGGGGGGGYLTGSGFSAASSTAYTVTVGAGGSGGTDAIRGTNGSDSVFSTITSTGGGAAGRKGTSNQTGIAGGSGGGGGMNDNGDGTTYAGGAGTSGQGYAGGSGRHVTPTWLGGGGGGGAGGAGVSSAVTTAPNGGAGITSSISGTSVGYAGGGGGSHSNASYVGTATDGGGAASATGNGTNGTVSLGGGGGAGVWYGSTGGNGGSGIVIVRYAK